MATKTLLVLPVQNPHKEEPKTGEQPNISLRAENVDGDQIVPSANTRKKIGMVIIRNNYNRKHHLSKKSRSPKQGALRL